MRVQGARAMVRSQRRRDSSDSSTIYQNGKGGFGINSLRPWPSRAGRPTVDAKYSTAPDRAGQHLFFDRQHHARLQKPARRVVNPDRDERAPLVEHQYVHSFLPTFRGVACADCRAVANPSRLLAR
jgi:hypothetical protein